MSNASIRVLLVGHCGPDAYALRSALNTILPGAAVEFVGSEAELQAALSTSTLLLVNRVLDGEYATDSGIELIRGLSGSVSKPMPKTMLVSNFPEAQEEAVQAGALPGFGKMKMNSEDARRKIRAAVGLG